MRAGSVQCLLGENGAGKSTLCNLIFGVYEPTAGDMVFDGAAWAPGSPAEALEKGIAMVHQHFSLVPRMTVVENLMLGQVRGVLKRHEFGARIRDIAESFGFTLDPEAVVGELSVGERQRAEIVKCLMRDPKLLVLDEPTAVLPPGEIGALLDICRRVADSGRAVILVTHKLAEIAKVADRVAVLRTGRLVADESMKDADMGALVHAMVGRELRPLDVALAEADEAPAIEESDGPKGFALVCDGLTVHDRHGAVRLDNFTLEIRPGEIVGLAGVEGNGQSELGMVLAGLLRPTEGHFYIGGTDLTHAGAAAVTAAGGGIVPEDRHAVACVTAMSVAENMFLNKLDRFTRFGLLQRGALNAAAQKQMREFDVRAAGPEVAFSGLSGGNQQKAVLARELTLDPLVALVAAQPTRGLDVSAVEAVYRQIRAAARRGVGVLLISSELDELLAVADRVAVLYRGRLVGERPAEMTERGAIGALMSGQSRMTALAFSLPDRRRLLGMAVPFIAVVGSMIVGLLLIAASGKDVPDAIEAFMDGAFGIGLRDRRLDQPRRRAVAGRPGLHPGLPRQSHQRGRRGPDRGRRHRRNGAGPVAADRQPAARACGDRSVAGRHAGRRVLGRHRRLHEGALRHQRGDQHPAAGLRRLAVVYWCVQSTALLRQPQTSSATLPESLSIADCGQAARA